MGRERKQNRVFLGVPLHTAGMIDHTQLSHFRTGMSVVQMVNLLVYILHLFFEGGVLGDHLVHAVDSTEIANDCFRPLASLEIQGQKIRIYDEYTCAAEAGSCPHAATCSQSRMSPYDTGVFQSVPAGCALH
ncbi:MAG: hypothetical protein GY801_40015 [bacterium]|nr:hypothetical protein [bacterium]